MPATSPMIAANATSGAPTSETTTTPATAGVPTSDTPAPQAHPQAGAGLPSPLPAMTGRQSEKRGCAEGAAGRTVVELGVRLETFLERVVRCRGGVFKF